MREHEPMHFSLTRDLDEFAALAEDFLAQSLERNLMATVLANARHVGATSTGPLLAYALTDDDEVCAAALRMPPWPLLVGDLPDAAADPLIEAWLALDPEVAAVNGPAASARAVASAWSRRTGKLSSPHERGHARTRAGPDAGASSAGSPAPGHPGRAGPPHHLGEGVLDRGGGRERRAG